MFGKKNPSASGALDRIFWGEPNQLETLPAICSGQGCIPQPVLMFSLNNTPGLCMQTSRIKFGWVDKKMGECSLSDLGGWYFNKIYDLACRYYVTQ